MFVAARLQWQQQQLFLKMAALTKADLRAALQLKGVPVPPSSYKKDVLVRLYREHVPGSEARLAAGLDFSSDEDEEPSVEVSPEVRSLTNDDLFAKLQQLGQPVGPIVDSTRGVYEKRLQQLLSPAMPRGRRTTGGGTPQFSASEEEEEEEEGTPLQDAPVARLSGHESSRGEGGAFLYSAGHLGGPFVGSGEEDVPVVSRTSTTFTTAGMPARRTLHARAAGVSRNEATSQGGLSLGAKVATVVVLVAACLLVYANLEYFKADVPVPSVIDP